MTADDRAQGLPDRPQTYHEILTPGMQELAAAGRRLNVAVGVAMEGLRLAWAKAINNWAAAIEEKNRDQERAGGSRPPEAEGGLD